MFLKILSTLEHQSPLGKSDHEVLTFDYLCSIQKNPVLESLGKLTLIKLSSIFNIELIPGEQSLSSMSQKQNGGHINITIMILC